jgi:hypothetical protein
MRVTPERCPRECAYRDKYAPWSTGKLRDGDDGVVVGVRAWYKCRCSWRWTIDFMG